MIWKYGLGEMVLAEAIDSLCRHYRLAGLPTRRTASKERADIEMVMPAATMRILTPLSFRAFRTLAEMNDVVSGRRRALDDAPLTREGAARSQPFAPGCGRGPTASSRPRHVAENRKQFSNPRPRGIRGKVPRRARTRDSFPCCPIRRSS